LRGRGKMRRERKLIMGDALIVKLILDTTLLFLVLLLDLGVLIFLLSSSF
jgi:hypothetical protein